MTLATPRQGLQTTRACFQIYSIQVFYHPEDSCFKRFDAAFSDKCQDENGSISLTPADQRRVF